MKRLPNNGDYIASLVYSNYRYRVWATSDGVRYTLRNKEK